MCWARPAESSPSAFQRNVVRSRSRAPTRWSSSVAGERREPGCGLRHAPTVGRVPDDLRPDRQARVPAGLSSPAQVRAVALDHQTVREDEHLVDEVAALVAVADHQHAHPGEHALDGEAEVRDPSQPLGPVGAQRLLAAQHAAGPGDDLRGDRRGEHDVVVEVGQQRVEVVRVPRADPCRAERGGVGDASWSSRPWHRRYGACRVRAVEVCRISLEPTSSTPSRIVAHRARDPSERVSPAPGVRVLLGRPSVGRRAGTCQRARPETSDDDRPSVLDGRYRLDRRARPGRHGDGAPGARPAARARRGRQGVPRGRTTDGDDLLRNRAEIRVLATLSHPGLVTLHDAGTVHGDDGSQQVYLVMELVAGPTLAERLRRRRPRRRADGASSGRTWPRRSRSSTRGRSSIATSSRRTCC